MGLLPNYEKADINIQKVRGYILNQNHPIGKHKAKVLQAILSINSNDAERFVEMIKAGLRFNHAISGKMDIYGQRYFVDMKISNFDKAAIIRTAWIVESKDGVPRFISCYIVSI